MLTPEKALIIFLVLYTIVVVVGNFQKESASWPNKKYFTSALFVLFSFIIWMYSRKYCLVRNIAILMFPQFFTKNLSKLLITILTAHSMTHIIAGAQNLMVLVDISQCVSSNMSEMAEKLGNSQIPLHGFVDDILKHNQTILETAKILEELDDSMISALERQRNFFEELRELHSKCNETVDVIYTRCNGIMENASKSCHESFHPIVCSAFAPVKHICKLLWLGQLTCNLPKKVQAFVKEGIGSAMDHGRRYIEQRANNSLFWNLILQGNDSSLLINQTREYDIKIEHDLHKFTSKMKDAFDTMLFCANICLLILDGYFINTLRKAILKTNDDIKKGKFSKPPELMSLGSIWKTLKKLMTKTKLYSLLSSIAFAIGAIAFSSVVYWFVNESIKTAGNTLASSGFEMKVTGNGFMSNSVQEFINLFQMSPENNGDKFQQCIAVHSQRISAPSTEFWSVLLSLLAISCYLSQVFIDWGQYWLARNFEIVHNESAEPSRDETETKFSHPVKMEDEVVGEVETRETNSQQ